MPMQKVITFILDSIIACLSILIAIALAFSAPGRKD